MLWLLDATGNTSPGLLVIEELVQVGLDTEELAAGVEVILPGLGTCGGAQGMGRQRGMGASWAAGSYRCTRVGWSREPGRLAQAGTTDGRHRARRLGTGTRAAGATAKRNSALLFSVEKTPESAMSRARSGQGFFSWSQ